MNCLSRLRRSIRYESLSWHDSHTMPGVRFAIRKASLSQRLDLVKGIRELTLRYEFLKAGDVPDQLEANMADLLVRKLYVEWGLQAVSGLKIDAQTATTESLVDKGPEMLLEEVLTKIKAENELSDDERKNF